MPDLPAAEANTEPRIQHHAQDDQPPTWRWVDYLGPLPSRKGQCFFLIGIDTLGSGLPSLCVMLLPRLPSIDRQNDLPTVTVFYAALLLIKELTSQQKNCSSGPGLMEFTRSPPS